MSCILEFYRGEILRQKHPLPKGHTAENFLMECLFLGAIFPVECGLLRLSSREFAVTSPFLWWERQTPLMRQLWLRNAVVLYQVVDLHKFGEYVEVE